MIRESGWNGRVITAYRPDPVVDPHIRRLSPKTSSSSARSRAKTRRRGRAISTPIATAAPSSEPWARPRPITATRAPQTADLPRTRSAALYAEVLRRQATAADAEMFRAQMLTEMAAMSLDDGLVMQLHPGSCAQPQPASSPASAATTAPIFRRRPNTCARSSPCSIASAMTRGFTLHPVHARRDGLFAASSRRSPAIIPRCELGPPWWFFDSREGMKRFREIATETAGFYNTVGFNDDTRAFLLDPRPP